MLTAKSSALVRRSSEDMAALIHRDFVYVTAGGRILTKADYIDVSCVSGKVVYVTRRLATSRSGGSAPLEGAHQFRHRPSPEHRGACRSDRGARGRWIVETGSHAELMAASGRYRHMVNMQMSNGHVLPVERV